MSPDLETIRFKHIPSPYSYFDDTFKAWLSPSRAKALAASIRDHTPAALDYLEGAIRYAWRVWMILGGRGEASPGSLNFTLAWDRPKSAEEARKVLDEADAFQVQIREVIAEVEEEIAGLKGEDEEARIRLKDASELEPFKQALRGFKDLIQALEGVKFRMKTAMDEEA